MGITFHDISKYYAVNIVDNILTIGKIVYNEEVYTFARDSAQGSFNLVDTSEDVTRMLYVIGEIHPRSALDKMFAVKVNSCLYINENMDSGEIEVRSIHKGMATAIYSMQQCPLILWNPMYEEHRYFDVMDIQNVFTEKSLKNSFTAGIAESLREYELFPPLVQMPK